MAFVFQSYNLLNSLTVDDNIKLVQKKGRGEKERIEVLEAVGLKDKQKAYPSSLSGGQQQRVSIARALAKDCDIFLCDEPIGALDTKTGDSIMKLLKNLSDKGKTVIVVTHNLDYLSMANKVIYVKDGQVNNCN